VRLEVSSEDGEITMCCGDGDEADQLYPPLPDDVDALARSIAEGSAPADLYRAILESQCGATDDSQAIDRYDGTLGVTTGFVSGLEPAVGQLQWTADLAAVYTEPGNVSGVRWCSGTLIGSNLFLTAGHCFDPVRDPQGWNVPLDNTTGNPIPPAEIATRMQGNMNFQVDTTGAPTAEQSFAVTDLVEYRLGSLDFAIVRVAGDPEATFGRTRLAGQDAPVGETIAVIGHPAGQRKRVEAGPVTALAGDRVTYNDIDTLGGNSGSGILHSPGGQIVGVHTNGGCTTSGQGANFGVRISSLLRESPTLSVMAPTAHVPVGEPSGYYTPLYEAARVVYRGVDGHVHELYLTAGQGGQWGHADLSALAGGPAAAGEPVGYYTPLYEAVRVVYRGVDGHAHELYLTPGQNGQWAHADLSALVG
jgi:V8-like Glu-specific endopeptidase